MQNENEPDINNIETDSITEINASTGTTEVDISSYYESLFQRGQVEFITFHPAYSYEEFIEGITVETGNKDGHNTDLKYILKEGLFKRLCKKALASAMGIPSEEAETKMRQKLEFLIYNKKTTPDSIMNLEGYAHRIESKPIQP